MILEETMIQSFHDNNSPRVSKSLRFVCSFILALPILIVFRVPCIAQSGSGISSAGMPKQVDEMTLFSEIPSICSASKFEQKVTEAPASISIVTASEIKMYGYRTLADIIRSIRGFNVTNDRNYSYVGVRGFGRPGDYNTRVLLLLDGHRINDSANETASIGEDFPLDVDLIDRVEFIRGPSSSLYGANAFFGVINVITKRGRDLKGVELSTEAGSFDTYKGRGSYGNKFSNGLEILGSATYFTSGGQNLFFKEFNSPAMNNGIAEGCDYEHVSNFFTKTAFKDFTMTGGYNSREKGIPTGAFGTMFNDTRSRTVDDKAFWDLTYDHRFENQLAVTARLTYDHYEYHGDYLYNLSPPEDPLDLMMNRDITLSETVGAEFQVTKKLFEKHKMTAGFEYRNSFLQDLENHDEKPFLHYLDEKMSSANYGVYLQDEFQISSTLRLNAGVRHDEYQSFGGTTNPRLGLIYHPFEKTVFKFLYGSAFRPPNIYELYYTDTVTQKGNPHLKPEEITTYELVWEQFFGRYLRASTSVFYNAIDNLISCRADPLDGMSVFMNADEVVSKGIEFELQGKFPKGIKGRVSYVFQRAEDATTGHQLTNSSDHEAKLNVILPLLPERLFLGTEMRYLSPRKTLAGGKTDDAFVTNLTLYAPNVIERLSLSASVYNLFDQEYGDPGSVEHVQDIILQDGISFRLKATYLF